jgi:ABC-type sugar transport system permease subunit
VTPATSTANATQRHPADAGGDGGAGGTAPRRPRRRRDGTAAAAFLALAILLVGFVFFYPTVAVILTSLQDPRSGAFVGMANYGALFRDEIFQDAVRNNLKLLVVLPVVVALALVVAQVLFDRIRGWRLYRALIFLPYIVPVVVAALVFGQILQQNGLVNSVLRFLHLDFLAHDWLGDPSTAIWSLAGVVVWRELAFGVVLFLARMTQLPMDLFDAARVDGANWWQRLRHVTVPQMATIIAFYCGIVLIALLSWVFNYVLVLTRGGPGTSTYVIEYYVYSRAFQYGDFGNAAALSSIMLVVILLVMGTYLTVLGKRGVL